MKLFTIKCIRAKRLRSERDNADLMPRRTMMKMCFESGCFFMLFNCRFISLPFFSSVNVFLKRTGTIYSTCIFYKKSYHYV